MVRDPETRAIEPMDSGFRRNDVDNDGYPVPRPGSAMTGTQCGDHVFKGEIAVLQQNQQVVEQIGSLVGDFITLAGCRCEGRLQTFLPDFLGDSAQPGIEQFGGVAACGPLLCALRVSLRRGNDRGGYGCTLRNEGGHPHNRESHRYGRARRGRDQLPPDLLRQSHKYWCRGRSLALDLGPQYGEPDPTKP